MTITNLPVDLFVLIVDELTARDFLALCSTCKDLHHPNSQLHTALGAYWRKATHRKFRLPNRPAVEGDGKKWQKLYRRLQTQTSVFTWGKSNRGCLGRQADPRCNPVPLPVGDIEELGIIADMQCGGWSTSFLTSRGVLYVAGVFDGDRQRTPAEKALQGATARLAYPESLPDPLRKDNPNNSLVAIRQFSSGRKHILGLSDSGRIWTWFSHAEPAMQVKFTSVDTHEHKSLSNTVSGVVKQVVAGWGMSSAYVSGVGIILWHAVKKRAHPDQDTWLVEATTVPLTKFESRLNKDRSIEWEDEDGTVGAVLNWVVLEHYVIFITDIGRIFAAQVEELHDTVIIHNSVELLPLRSNKPYPSTCDVQGSFRSFAVLMNGSVTVLLQDWLDSYLNSGGHSSLPTGALVPVLQNSGVQQLAFGDYHYHALHSNGTITSYGKEPSACGCLGLGGHWRRHSRTIRGVLHNHDAELIREAYLTGRQVWFEPQKQTWLDFLSQGGKDPDESKERREILESRGNGLAELSDWVEQRGRAWNTFSHVDNDNDDDDGLGAHFALSVSAAGWSSGALVLVNRDLTAKMEARGKFWEDEEFPRLRLKNGTEMPGTIEISEL